MEGLPDWFQYGDEAPTTMQHQPYGRDPLPEEMGNLPPAPEYAPTHPHPYPPAAPPAGYAGGECSGPPPYACGGVGAAAAAGYGMPPPAPFRPPMDVYGTPAAAVPVEPPRLTPMSLRTGVITAETATPAGRMHLLDHLVSIVDNVSAELFRCGAAHLADAVAPDLDGLRTGLVKLKVCEISRSHAKLTAAARHSCSTPHDISTLECSPGSDATDTPRDSSSSVEVATTTTAGRCDSGALSASSGVRGRGKASTSPPQSAQKPAAAAPTVDDSQAEPCGHNNWDNVRARRGTVTLRCRTCQTQWRMPLSTVRRCPQFDAGRCTKGSACAKYHVHRSKQSLSDRVQVFGDELLKRVPSKHIPSDDGTTPVDGTSSEHEGPCDAV